MSRIMVVYGTRPEAIKMAPLVAGLRAHWGLQPIVTVTGQHREMLDQVNDLFGIVPDFDLKLMVPGATLAELSARALTATSKVLSSVRPDVVVVQGDTSSALMAALAAFYQRLPIVHLEAGLRTGNIQSPFPEEANRRLISPIADLHLAPTPEARRNLLREDVEPNTVVVTGNTVIDALQEAVKRSVAFTDDRVNEFLKPGGRLLVVTTHRRESWGEPMIRAMSAVGEIARKYPDLNIMLPMHRNVTVREVVEPILGTQPNVLLTEPLSYHEFTHVLRRATLVLTDSGGIQEEAPSLGVPVLVLRDSTERPEAVTAGTVRLVGTDPDLIIEAASQLLEDPVYYSRVSNASNPYGDGEAGPRAVAAIAHLVGLGTRMPDFDPEQ